MLVRAGHPLLHDDSLEISQFPVIATGPFREGDRTLGGLSGIFELQPVMTVESPEALVRVAATSDVVLMSSTLGSADELATGTLVKLNRPSVGDGHRFEVRLYSVKQRSPSPIATETKDRLRRIFGSI